MSAIHNFGLLFQTKIYWQYKIADHHKWLIFWSAIFVWVIITLGDEYYLCVYIYIYVIHHPK
jgi:hypothetical protein